MKKLLMLSPVLLAAVVQAQAQEINVSGKLLDAEGKPLEGASVVVKETNRGVLTNAQGGYSLQARSGQTLVFSGVGFSTQERLVDNPIININLSEATNALNDVVVVGYGSQKRANITGSVVSLSNQTLTKRQVASSSSLLQGLAPGVTVQQQSGKPGADGASIRIRGVSSLYGSSSPLVIVDDVVSSFEQIDPNAIESINLYKDAASTSIYGARASNGVVVVKTKRAANKGLTMSYNNFVSKQQATAIPDRVSAIDHMILSNVAEQNRTGNPASFLYPQTLIEKYRTTPANNLDVIDTDWTDLLFTNSGILQNHNVQISAGGEKVSLFGSATFLDQKGLIPNSAFRKYDIRLNPDIRINDKFSIRGNFGYNSNETLNPSTGSAEFIIRQAIGLPAIGAGKFGDGRYGNAGQTNNRNPLAMAEAAGTSVSKVNTLLSKVALNYRPVNGLELEAYWAREYWTPNTKTFVKNVDIYQPNLVTQGYDKVGVWPGTTSLGESYSSNERTTYLAQATYSKKIKDHQFKALLGGQTELFTYSGISASRTGFINPNQPFLNLGASNFANAGSGYETALAGAYGRINYNFQDKYLLEVNGRYDGSSRFSQELNKQWGLFTSASAGYVISKEKFWNAISDKITFAKIRGSIGGLGNQSLPEVYPFAVNYQATGYSNPNNGTSTYFNNTTNLGYALLEAPNPNITWETSSQWNIGLDLGIGKSLTLTADYYVRSLKDMLLIRPIPTYIGLSSPYINAGRMENKGWELQLNYRKNFGKLSVDLTGMLSDVKNNVTSLPGLPFLDGGSVRTQEGQALFSYFGYRALGYFQDSNAIKGAPIQFGVPFSTNPAVGPKPGDVQYADISGPAGTPDGKVDQFDRTYLGNNFPRMEYSFNFNFRYAAFDLNLFAQGVGMRDNYLSGTGAVPFASNDFAASLLEMHKDYWRPDNRNPLFPRLLPAGSGGNNYVTSSLWIRSASYLRLKNANLGFTLPKAWAESLKIRSARVFVSGSNLFTITKSWKGFDPEINNADGQFYPLMRTYTAGVNLNF